VFTLAAIYVAISMTKVGTEQTTLHGSLNIVIHIGIVRGGVPDFGLRTLVPGLSTWHHHGMMLGYVGEKDCRNFHAVRVNPAEYLRVELCNLWSRV
jgi:hypothetical protein